MTNLSTRYLDDDTDLYQCVASAFDNSEPVQQQKHTSHPAEGVGASCTRGGR